MTTFYKFSCSVLVCITLAACQSNTSITTEPVAPKATLPQKPIEPESKVKVIPYPSNEIKRESKPVPNTAPTPSQPPRVILPSQSAQPIRQLKDGKGIVAYEKAMQDYQNSLKNNNLNDAEKSLLQAQRIAPQSADVYRELARLANLRKQGGNAEAFARKGLTFAQSNVQRKQLWQQILLSAQLRNQPILIQQAQQQISKF